jgi:hypothetical protein
MSKEELQKELEKTIQEIADITGEKVETITEELDKAESIDDILIAATEWFK